MKTILTLAAATAVGIMMGGTAAGAAVPSHPSVCVSHNARIGSPAYVFCATPHKASLQKPVLRREPMIHRATFHKPAPAQSLMVSGPQNCKPGDYWEFSGGDHTSTRVMACR